MPIGRGDGYRHHRSLSQNHKPPDTGRSIIDHISPVEVSAAVSTFEANRYRVNGIDMNVVIAGEGPDVLLVHGFPDTHAVWRKQIPALVAAGYRVIAPDTRGCGDTEISPEVASYKVDNLVRDLKELLDVLGVDKVRLVAHDWGAVQGWQFAIRHPERVERYIALSVGHPTAYGRAGFWQKLKGYYILLIQLRGLVEFMLSCGNWFLFRLMTGYPEEFPHWKAALERPGRLSAGCNYYRANPGMILGREYPFVTMPVCGLWSDGDRFLTERQMVESRQYVQGPWQYRRVEGANHWLQLDAPEKVNTLLLEFLK
jgi:pimeloyl-ACP methyl ester carboxylesterase